MKRRTRQNIFDDATCSLPTALVLFQDDIDLQAGFNVFAVLAIHKVVVLKGKYRSETPVVFDFTILVVIF
jgi:hypothetical protein